MDVVKATHADLNPVLDLADIVGPAVGAGDGQERDPDLIRDFDLWGLDFGQCLFSYVDNGEIAWVDTGGSSTTRNISPSFGVGKDNCRVLGELRREELLDLCQLRLGGAVGWHCGLDGEAEEGSCQDAEEHL
ncbi:uncharacterized protein DSM5745_06831 [Aspergillus mulundensis]|uniref:Uncharacterized protein n=1 Tax=Aspergillus mulundensis TaxID=1810919 RepID=A0A3D8RS20_9EURO|nr:hypothetical protein DSM5745_06831 [Aspergillus mulundensis]RDW76839.1 hypothetical protein DSM5745_06831 [Aspergillus mulundensis]